MKLRPWKCEKHLLSILTLFDLGKPELSFKLVNITSTKKTFSLKNAIEEDTKKSEQSRLKDVQKFNGKCFESTCVYLFGTGLIGVLLISVLALAGLCQKKSCPPENDHTAVLLMETSIKNLRGKQTRALALNKLVGFSPLQSVNF